MAALYFSIPWQSIRMLGRAFVVNDRLQNGLFDFVSFEAVLAKAGIFLRRQELTKLFKFYDVHGNERVDYREFLRGILGEMNERRFSMVQSVFEALDQGGKGQISVADAVQAFDPSNHPLVPLLRENVSKCGVKRTVQQGCLRACCVCWCARDGLIRDLF